MAMTNVMKKAAIKTAYSYLEKNPEENMLKLMDWLIRMPPHRHS